jgi:hypothetical protein
MHQVTPVFVPHSTYFLPTLKKKLNYDMSDGFVFMVFNATFNNIKAVSFIGGGNQSTQRKSPNCSKSLTNFIT